MPSILVTGGSGYLGQFLRRELAAQGHSVWWTYVSTGAEHATGQSFRVNLATGEGLEDCLLACAPLDAVIHTAALSQPAVCERDEEAARALNVPTLLLAALRRHSPHALFVHLSTDQVYDGSRPFWSEADAASCVPVNAYGRSKRSAEELVRCVQLPLQRLISRLILRPRSPLF
jgi:dTDP-4-dehydrorhamnose reductase